jgi:SIT4 phosphatase-associated protein
MFSDEQTVSTEVTQKDSKQKKPNKFELFEKLLSFLDTEDELNPVLCGYFCKLFQVLVGNKAKEVFNYIYNHPECLDLLVRHVYNKSISDVLIRLLNVQDTVLDEGLENVDTIRQSFVFKVIEKLAPKHSLEDHLNAQNLLSELADYKQIYLELTSSRSCALYKSYLSSECQSSKVNTYILLCNIIAKYNVNENYQKRINIASFH